VDAHGRPQRRPRDAGAGARGLVPLLWTTARVTVRNAGGRKRRHRPRPRSAPRTTTMPSRW
jgi:hypothetical protein